MTFQLEKNGNITVMIEVILMDTRIARNKLMKTGN